MTENRPFDVLIVTVPAQFTTVGSRELGVGEKGTRGQGRQGDKGTRGQGDKGAITNYQLPITNYQLPITS
ncbi:hypothetical protein [Chroococcidiopsis cubana]|uniref:hypothetical protein n=1 Tax=Chroococcidiopsis cubana TaxID=171392 RepID=UPI002ACD6891|nr:hypothetical protein [Chroococcidiopsis cubana]